MPTYCYSTEDGEVFNWEFPAGTAPPMVLLKDGRTATRDYQAEAVGGIVKGTDNPVIPRRKIWPMEPCVASGVHANQAQELRDHYKKHGLSIEVPPSGDPIYESAGQRKKGLKCRGMHDRASFN